MSPVAQGPHAAAREARRRPHVPGRLPSGREAERIVSFRRMLGVQGPAAAKHNSPSGVTVRCGHWTPKANPSRKAPPPSAPAPALGPRTTREARPPLPDSGARLTSRWVPQQSVCKAAGESGAAAGETGAAPGL